MFDISTYNREYYGTCTNHIDEVSKYAINYKQWFNIAYELHKDQVDKSGREYNRHCASVAYIAYEIACGMREDFIDKNTLLCVAMFHDVIEDVKDGKKRLTQYLKKDITININNVISCIKILSHLNSKKESYKDYIYRILESNDKIAITVKYADILDHIANLPYIPDNETRERLERKYEGLTELFHNKLMELELGHEGMAYM